LPIIYDTVEALFCLSRNQQLFCNYFHKKSVILFATGINPAPFLMMNPGIILWLEIASPNLLAYQEIRGGN